MMFVVLTTAVTGAAAETDSAPTLTDSCERFQNTQPLCLFNNPEDLAVLADGTMLLVSEYGDYAGTRPGALVFYDIEKRQRRSAFVGGEAILPDEYWGDSSCIDPPGESFSPHGIDLFQREDGRWQLLVVQHGGRESVEFFELGNAGGNPQLIWRGCAVAPEKAVLNSVAATGSEEFFTTKIHSTDHSWEGAEDALSKPTGVVYRWRRGSGFQMIEQTRGVMLNGIAAAPEEEFIYVVYSGENLLKKIDTRTGKLVASTQLAHADHLNWEAAGKTLLAASFSGSQSNEIFAACMVPDVEVCPIPFAIVEIEPGTLASKVLFQNTSAAMGAGTVGMKVGSRLFIGSFAGNRLLEVELNTKH